MKTGILKLMVIGGIFIIPKVAQASCSGIGSQFYGNTTDTVYSSQSDCEAAEGVVAPAPAVVCTDAMIYLHYAGCEAPAPAPVAEPVPAPAPALPSCYY